MCVSRDGGAASAGSPGHAMGGVAGGRWAERSSSSLHGRHQPACPALSNPACGLLQRSTQTAGRQGPRRQRPCSSRPARAPWRPPRRCRPAGPLASSRPRVWRSPRPPGSSRWEDGVGNRDCMVVRGLVPPPTNGPGRCNSCRCSPAGALQGGRPHPPPPAAAHPTRRRSPPRPCRSAATPPCASPLWPPPRSWRSPACRRSTSRPPAPAWASTRCAC